MSFSFFFVFKSISNSDAEASFHTEAILRKSRPAFVADLDADGRELIGETTMIVGKVDFILVIGNQGVFALVVEGFKPVVPEAGSHGQFTVEDDMTGVEPVDFEVTHQRVARLAQFADGITTVVIGELSWVEAIGGSDADDLGEAACVGGVEGTKIVHFRIIVVSTTPAETAGRHKSIAEAELVLVASDGVALRKDRHHQGHGKT